MKKIFTFTIVFFYFAFLQVTEAKASTLFIPDVFKVIKVNGVEQSMSFFSKETHVQLKEGRNTLILQYVELFEDSDNDDHATIRSDKHILIFRALKQHDYVLLKPEFGELKPARAFAKAPHFTIKVNNKNVKLFSKDLTEFEAAIAFKKLEASLDEQFSSPLAIEGVTQEPMKIKTSAFEKEKGTIKSVQNVESFTMLKYWWEKADKKQKSQFIEYINQQK